MFTPYEYRPATAGPGTIRATARGEGRLPPTPDQRGGWYVQQATSVWDKEKKQPKKVTTHLGTITKDGEFIPKTPRESPPTTNREIYEYANGALALHFLEDVHDLLAESTSFADELLAMAIIRAIDP